MKMTSSELPLSRRLRGLVLSPTPGGSRVLDRIEPRTDAYFLVVSPPG